MKKLYTLLFIAFTTLGIAQNLVVNPTFANTLTGWSATGTNYALPNHVTTDDTIKEQYRQIFLISHEMEIKEMFERVVEV